MDSAMGPNVDRINAIEPPGTYSNMILSFSARSVPRYFTMLGWSNERNISTSISIALTSLSLCQERACLMQTSIPVLWHRPKYTSQNPPQAVIDDMVYWLSPFVNKCCRNFWKFRLVAGRFEGVCGGLSTVQSECWDPMLTLSVSCSQLLRTYRLRLPAASSIGRTHASCASIRKLGAKTVIACRTRGCQEGEGTPGSTCSLLALCSCMTLQNAAVPMAPTMVQHRMIFGLGTITTRNHMEETPVNAHKMSAPIMPKVANRMNSLQVLIFSIVSIAAMLPRFWENADQETDTPRIRAGCRLSDVTCAGRGTEVASQGQT
mmetsp:Transcript_5566/g.10047  ORF Transcript_5566/g.10047 Transcript_5566/m.10047 type:complete len:319 (-) Transcript_5566:237-1193(-)